MATPSKNVFDYPARFQWNQPNVSRALAQTACTDTCVQMIIEYYKDKLISLNNIRYAAGVGVDGQHGLTMGAAIRALRAYGVTWYTTATNVSASWVLQKAYIGPVLTGVGYGKYPKKKNGGCSQANIAQEGGGVDCSFTDAHAILILGNTAVKDSTGKVIRYDVFSRDPDHWSDTPHYDRITGEQLTNTMKALVTDTAWSGTFAIYSTRKK